jgi:hypothetical protein
LIDFSPITVTELSVNGARDYTMTFSLKTALHLDEGEEVMATVLL